jgi:hypothetical protein
MIGDLSPDIFALHKVSVIECKIADIFKTSDVSELRAKAKAYAKLLATKFNLPESDEAWKLIDEPPSSYEDCRNSVLLSEDQIAEWKAVFHL